MTTATRNNPCSTRPSWDKSFDNDQGTCPRRNTSGGDVLRLNANRVLKLTNCSGPIWLRLQFYSDVLLLVVFSKLGPVSWVGRCTRSSRGAHGSAWRHPCDEEADAPRMKGGGGLHPARPDRWPPTKRPRAAPGGLIAASVRCSSPNEGVPPCSRTSPPLGGSSEVHRTSWRIPFPRHAWTFLVLGFQGAWLSHAPPRVPKQRRP